MTQPLNRHPVRVPHSTRAVARAGRSWRQRAARALGTALAGLALLAPGAGAQITLHFEDMFGPCGEQGLVQGPASWTSQGVTVVSGLSSDGLLNQGAVHTPSLTDSLGLWTYEGATITFPAPMGWVQLRVGTNIPSQTPPTFRITSGGGEVLSFTLPNGASMLVDIPLSPPSTQIGIQYVTGSHGLLPIDRLFALPASSVFHVPDDVVGHWPMESSEPALTLSDAAGALDGSFTSACSHLPGAVGDGLSMPGPGFAVVPDGDAIDFGSGDFSVAFWLRSTIGSGTASVLDKRGFDVSSVIGYHVYTWNGRLGFQLADGGWTNWTSTGFVADGEWHHVAVSVDRDQTDGLRFYVDGVALPDVIDPTVRSGSLSNASDLTLWKSSDWLAVKEMDELVLADRVLSPMEIASLAGVGPVLAAPDPWADLGAALPGSLGAPLLVGTGSLEPDSDGELLLTNAKGDAQAALCVSVQSTPLAFKGGLLKTLPLVSLTDVTIPSDGVLSLPFTWPSGVPSGVPVYQQYLIQDTGAVHGVAISNCVMGVTP